LDNSAKRTLWRRFWAETVVAAISGSLCLITLLWPDWIEAASGWDPDQHDGAVEWAIVATLLLVTIVMLAIADRSRRRLRLADGV
jgi:hypothetical protein